MLNLIFNMQDILENVQEDMQYQTVVHRFRKFLFFAIMLALVFIVILTVRSFWESKIAEQNNQISSLILALQDQKQLDDDRSKLESTLEKNNNPFVSFAKLKLAELCMQDKDFAKAALLFKEIIAAKDVNTIVSQYAKIMLVSVCLDHGGILSADELAKYAQDLGSPNEAFYGNGAIVKSLYFISVNQKQEAENLMNILLNNPDVSNLLKVQASAIIASLHY